VHDRGSQLALDKARPQRARALSSPRRRLLEAVAAPQTLAPEAWLWLCRLKYLNASLIILSMRIAISEEIMA
jgi:hypothetical protein